MLAVKLLFGSHFHINIADKVGEEYWMRRWEVHPSRSFLLPSLTSLLDHLPFSEFQGTSVVLIPLLSSGRWNSLNLLTLLNLGYENCFLVKTPWSSNSTQIQLEKKKKLASCNSSKSNGVKTNYWLH